MDDVEPNGLNNMTNNIAELQAAMETMQKKQSMIDSIIEETGDHVLVIDKDYKVLARNNAQNAEMVRRYHKSLEIGDHILDFLTDFPKARARMEELVYSTLKGQKLFLEKYKSIEKAADGHPIYYQMQLLPVRDKENLVIGAALMYRDITAKVRADEQIEYVIKHTANLTEQEFFNDLTVQMHKMFDANHIYLGQYYQDSNTIETKAYLENGKVKENFSYDLDLTPCSEIIKSNEFVRFENVREIFKSDEKLQRWKASSFWGIPITSPTTGTTLGIFVLAHDQEIHKVPNTEYLFNVVSLRAGAELESIRNRVHLKARDQQLEDITSNLPEVIYEYIIESKEDRNGRFTFVSQAVEEIYEVTAEDLYSNPEVVWKSIYKEDYAHFIEAIEKSGSELTTFHWTGRLVGRNSFKLRWVKITAKPQPYGEDGLKWHGVIDDISRIKHIEQELVHAKARAEELAVAKEDFLAVMSHEIRTPLNGIMGITSIMIEEATPEQMEYLNLLKFSAENLMTLINNILDFSKLNAGKIEVFETKMNLDLLFKNLEHAHAHRAKENNNELIIKLDEALPTFVLGDDMILLQILNNLIGNAVKFTSSGRVEVIVELVNESSTSLNLRFEIKDSGVGISEEDLTVIFEKFKQLGDKTQQSGGSGLGLGIAQKLIEILNSNLYVDSVIGQGTTFHFTLPFKKVEA